MKKLNVEKKQHQTTMLAQTIAKSRFASLPFFSKIVFVLFTAIIVMSGSAFAGEMKFPKPVGSKDIIPEGSTYEQIFSEGCFTEGVVSGKDGFIYFSDITLTQSCKDKGVTDGESFDWTIAFRKSYAS